MSGAWTTFAAVASAIIGLAIISVLLKSSNTSSVIQASTSGFANIINAASGNGVSTGGLSNGIGNILA